MAQTKKQAFSIPFIGYDHGKDFNWDFDVLFDDADPEKRDRLQKLVDTMARVRNLRPFYDFIIHCNI